LPVEHGKPVADGPQDQHLFLHQPFGRPGDTDRALRVVSDLRQQGRDHAGYSVLAESNLQRDVRLGTTRFATLPYIVKGTVRVSSAPALVGRVLAQTQGLDFCPLPIKVPPGRPTLAWHRRSERDQAGLWFREFIVACERDRVAEVCQAA